MKKLVLFFAAIVAVSFASCGPKTTTTEEATAVDSIEVETIVADTVAADTAVVVAQ